LAEKRGCVAQLVERPTTPTQRKNAAPTWSRVHDKDLLEQFSQLTVTVEKREMRNFRQPNSESE
jgi:hypothetical protein